MGVFLTLTFLLGAATSAAVVVIPGDATVLGTEIRLGEIAELRGVDAALRERLATLSLGRAAAPARERVLSGDTLRRRIHAVHPALHVEVPDQVHVHTAFREITPDFVRSHLERAIRHRMPWSDAAVSFGAWRLSEPFAAALAAQRVVVHFRTEESFLRRVHAEIELVGADGAPRIRRSASVVMSVRRPVVVTTADLHRGAVLKAEHLRLEERELGGLPRNVLRDLEHAAGLQLARTLSAGTPLVPGYLRSEPLVKRGDTVVVVAEGPGLSVQLEARALEAGVLGETIRFENRRTRYRFQAEVTGSGRARLHAPGVGSGR